MHTYTPMDNKDKNHVRIKKKSCFLVLLNVNRLKNLSDNYEMESYTYGLRTP